MSSYPVPAEQHDKLIRAALRVIAADHYADEGDPHADAESEYAGEQLALVARDLTRAVNALDPDRWPIGWEKDAETKPAEAAMTAWTGPDGTVYDLGHGLRDRDGDVWVCVGWWQPLDRGEAVPLMEWSDDRRELPEVIERFGPLTKRSED